MPDLLRRARRVDAQVVQLAQQPHGSGLQLRRHQHTLARRAHQHRAQHLQGAEGEGEGARPSDAASDGREGLGLP